ncbi:MAG: hypothetical protein R3F11_29350 [Verrucomicrobiales bacterium]
MLEDEPLIRKLIVANLRAHGFAAVETAEGSQTIERYREAKEAGGRST